jgi:hypothetical protein
LNKKIEVEVFKFKKQLIPRVPQFMKRSKEEGVVVSVGVVSSFA